MIRQTRLRRLRIGTDSVSWRASFVFPFFDTAFRVELLLVIVGREHFVFRDRLRRVRERSLTSLGYTSRPRLPLTEAEPDLFHELYHFDPWWTMRVAVGVPPAVRSAVIATNVAARKRGHLAIRDVLFDDDLERVQEVRIGDGVFRAVAYNSERPMTQEMRQSFFGLY